MSLGALLGIELPLLQAPMAGVQDSALAVAVCRAGGLGALPCAMLSADRIREEVHAIRAQTSAPFNLNFFCHADPPPDPDRDAAWIARLAPDYAALGIRPPATLDAGARRPFDETALELLKELRPPVVSFHFGLPPPHLLAPLRQWGCRILSSATTVEEGRWLERHGVDAVIAQGWEAGGHRAVFLGNLLDPQPGTFALVPQLVKALNVPIIAAGGVADAASVSAAIALGAHGVQVGTSYLLCDETRTSTVHRQALRDPHASTVVTNILTGRPARGIVNHAIRQWGPVDPQAPPFPRAASAMAALRTAAEARGSGDYSVLWAGQNRSGCRAIPAERLTRELARGLGPQGVAPVL